MRPIERLSFIVRSPAIIMSGGWSIILLGLYLTRIKWFGFERYGILILWGLGIFGILLAHRRHRDDKVTGGSDPGVAMSSELLYQSIIETFPDSVSVVDLEGRFIFCSKQTAGLHKYGHPDELIGENIAVLFPAGEDHLFTQLLQETLQTGMIKDFEVNLVEKDGMRFPAEMGASVIRAKNGTPYAVLITVRDVTERKWVEAQIRESEDLYRVVANNTYDWEFWQAPNDRFLYISPSCKRITGYDDIEFINNAGLFMDIIHPDDRAAFSIHQQGVNQLKVAGEIEFRIYRSDKSMRWISQVCQPIIDKDGKYLGVRGSNRDITEKRLTDQKLQAAYEQVSKQLKEIEQLHENLREQAIRDPLTGLYNRRYMEEALKQENSRAIREGHNISVVMLDVDDLKKINDEFGHIVGDKALQILGEHLRSLTRVEDIACRYGGDEFLIILHNMPARDAYKRAEEWRVHLEEKKVPYGHKDITITFTAGIASFPAGRKTVEQIIVAADNALYKAKMQGRNQVIVYNEPE